MMLVKTIIHVSKTISLKEIQLNDAEFLLELMHQIYPPVYKHLWEDAGNWYVETVFGSENLAKELLEENAKYYFVQHENEVVGILRIVYDAPLEGFEAVKATKLHRIYLSSKVQGKGVGKILMDWTIQQAVEKNTKLVWLESMDTQVQALEFYKKMGFESIGAFRLNFDLMHQHLRGMYTLRKVLD